jgi:hypothetical protein
VFEDIFVIYVLSAGNINQYTFQRLSFLNRRRLPLCIFLRLSRCRFGCVGF